MSQINDTKETRKFPTKMIPINKENYNPRWAYSAPLNAIHVTAIYLHQIATLNRTNQNDNNQQREL